MDAKFILGVCVGLIGSFLGALFAHIFAERRRKNDEFNKAAANFRAAFIPEVTFLRHNAKIDDAPSADNLCEFLRAGYVKRHLIAFETFNIYLSSNRRNEFQKAWEEYCHYDVEGEPNTPFFEQYFEKTWEGQPTKELALERIKRLLSFARFV
jgi:hypothetical protein